MSPSRFARAIWIPLHSGPGTHERIWVYRGRGKVVFSVDSRRGTLRVVQVVRARAAE